jgi:hypothetical protein
MQLTKQQMKVLAKQLDHAATLAGAHAVAVEDSAHLFESFFGEEVPEECYTIVGGTNKNEAGLMFNEFAVHGENMIKGENKSALDLVKKINELMNTPDE